MHTSQLLIYWSYFLLHPTNYLALRKEKIIRSDQPFRDCRFHMYLML
jgi:hypothetical protein